MWFDLVEDNWNLILSNHNNFFLCRFVPLAYSMGFLRFILTAILIWYTVRLVIRLLMPYFIQKLVQKAGSQFNKPYSENTKPEGTIEVDYMPPAKNKKSTGKAGDFVDYEEIK